MVHHAILQLVLLFPLLLALGRRFGRGPVFAAGSRARSVPWR